jgi:hypothetical protein
LSLHFARCEIENIKNSEQIADTNTWTAQNSMTDARADHTATLLPNGKIFVHGGIGDAGLLWFWELL